MRQITSLVVAVVAAGALAIAAAACSSPTAISPTPAPTVSASATSQPDACWGQATQVFARLGQMGQHASQQPNPRFGLRNLARALYDQGVIPDDSMQSLGAFVAAAYGLSIDACM